ncbi:hypothetical protein NJ76_02960 [Rhodococcus sp. IITR03]|nr:hypothetical protein NJ76_02960 [Rhodococcus sp. IITR03]
MSTYYQPPKYPASEFESMTPADETLPVVVVGAGPVGMAVALGLAQRGVPVTILEAADQVSFGSRAICISRHSLEAAARSASARSSRRSCCRGSAVAASTATSRSCTSRCRSVTSTSVRP